MQVHKGTSVPTTHPLAILSASSVAIFLFVQSTAGLAHHSAQAIYDVNNTDFQIEGEITEIRWRNPHIRIMVAVAAEDGTTGGVAGGAE